MRNNLFPTSLSTGLLVFQCHDVRPQVRCVSFRALCLPEWCQKPVIPFHPFPDQHSRNPLPLLEARRLVNRF
ncbi:hypothetical protein MIND_01052500 [Mycena indigotica]|uniref:Uncharacterized protein n=1 Tax=Mycena indigotica TaxID=2126181 RepID=A0A8H6SAF0_9AGAR|nr:uncharacterized protein MIND_01052500 [Mycena indigotica]KAF7295140.1 hypothetical protein MIND_01052500 [Mycena indigotica]